MQDFAAAGYLLAVLFTDLQHILIGPGIVTISGESCLPAA